MRTDDRSQAAPRHPQGLDTPPRTKGERKSRELTKIKAFTSRPPGARGQRWETVTGRVTSVCLVSALQSPDGLPLKHTAASLRGTHFEQVH